MQNLDNDNENNAAVDEIWTLMDSKPGTPECDRLVELGELAFEYQQAHYPIGKPSFIEWVKFHFERLVVLWMS